MPDGSQQAAPPPEAATEAIEKGWGPEQHPVIPESVETIYAPKVEGENEVVAGLVAETYRHAGGREA